VSERLTADRTQELAILMDVLHGLAFGIFVHLANVAIHHIRFLKRLRTLWAFNCWQDWGMMIFIGYLLRTIAMFFFLLIFL